MPTVPFLGSYGDISGSGLMFRNKLINGGFDIWQRSTSQTSSGYGSDDRWLNGHAGSSKTASRQTFTLGQTDVPGNPTYFARTVVTLAGSPTTSDYVLKRQNIEFVKTLAGQTATLSFWAKADASKNMAVEFAQSFGTGGSPSAQVNAISVTTFALTSSWKYFTATVNLPSISGKTIGTNGDDYVQMNFWLSAGSDYNARTNSLGQQSGTFDIANVQLEAGPQATPFEQRPIGVELNLCRRYLAYFPGNCDTMPAYILSPGTAALCLISLGTPLRSSPVSASMQISTAADFKVRKTDGGSVAASALTFDSGSLTCASVVLTGLTGLTTGDGSLVRIENSGFISFSAEL